MSPEFKVEIVVPYAYIVEAGDEDEAEEKGWEMFEENIDAWHNAAVVESVEEIKQAGNDKPIAIDEQTRQEVDSAERETRDRVDEIPLTEAFYRLTAEGRMPTILAQVDDETGQVEAARVRVAGVEYFFHQTNDAKANASRSSGTRVRHREVTRFRLTSSHLMGGGWKRIQ